MDKVRAFFRIVWQQRFWLLSVVGILVGVASWYVASGAIDAQFATNKSAIESQFSNMSGISSKTPHGNPDVNRKDLQQAALVAKGVKQLWEQLYAKQRNAVLKWPAVLGQTAFLDKIESKRFGDPSISSDMRDIYRNYIKNRFDALLEIVQAKKIPVDETGAPGTYGGGGGRGGYEGGYGGRGDPGMMSDPSLMEEEDYLVQWGDQLALRQKLVFDKQPTALQIWVTQEDLWVYETLLNVIAATNEERGATRPDNTAIRAINMLQVGADAALAFTEPGNVILPSSAAAGGEVPAEAPLAEGEGSVDAMLLAMRYINAEGTPEASATIETLNSQQFRRLPVRMKLIMDQQWLAPLLVKSANSALPIEVKRVRINPDKSGGAFAGETLDVAGLEGAEAGLGGRGGYGGGRGGYGGGYGGGRGGYGGGGYSGGESFAIPTGPGTSNLAEVDILGVVYIYNPPSDDMLTIPGAEEFTEGAAPGEIAAAE